MKSMIPVPVDAESAASKAVEGLLPIHQAQLLTYLKLTGIRLGILINFNTALLKDGIKRVVL
jgi:GxxExxY protein